MQPAIQPAMQPAVQPAVKALARSEMDPHEDMRSPSGRPASWLPAQLAVQLAVHVWAVALAGCGLERLAAVRDHDVQALVERFDTEFNTDFSAKSPNFRGLVLFCIEADLCIQIRIFQHFSRTTRFAILCTAPI